MNTSKKKLISQMVLITFVVTTYLGLTINYQQKKKNYSKKPHSRCYFNCMRIVKKVNSSSTSIPIWNAIQGNCIVLGTWCPDHIWLFAGVFFFFFGEMNHMKFDFTPSYQAYCWCYLKSRRNVFFPRKVRSLFPHRAFKF